MSVGCISCAGLGSCDVDERLQFGTPLLDFAQHKRIGVLFSANGGTEIGATVGGDVHACVREVGLGGFYTCTRVRILYIRIYARTRALISWRGSNILRGANKHPHS